MKYENFDQVKNYVKTIKEHEQKLELLNKQIVIKIINTDNNCIYTIGTGNLSDHEYRKQAKDLVEQIKYDLASRIDMLKGMVEKL